MQSCVEFMVEILESRCVTDTECEDGRAVVDMFSMIGNLTMVSGFFSLLLESAPSSSLLFSPLSLPLISIDIH